MTQKYDVVVIGAGPGGYIAALRAAQLGLKTACIEKDKTLGGTCLNVGCIPSKALLQSTEHYAWLQHHSEEHAIVFKEASIDFSKLMQRKDEIVQGLTQGVAGLFKKHGVTHISGTARFTSPHTLEISTGETVEADNFILATGSEPIPLPFLPFDEKLVISSTGALSLPKIPKQMAVIGGGAIGLELASVYSRLGSKVVIVEMLDRICPLMDEAVSKTLLQALKKQNLEFYLSAKLIKADREEDGLNLSIEDKGQTISLHTDVLLVAIGRRPYTQGLGLQEIGVATEKGLVCIDNNFRTSVPNIYAIGDVVTGPMLAHKASEEGYCVAEIIAGKRPYLNYIAIPNVVYTHPEAAAVGLTEKETREMGLEQIIIGTSMFRANSRARCAGDSEGLVKVIGAGKEGYLVGMHIVGPQASELINSGVVAIQNRVTLKELATSPTAHPTLSEAIKEACLAAK